MGDFEILGQCYHQTEITNINGALAIAAADFDGNQTTDLIMTCRGTGDTFGICFLALDGTVIKKDLDWLSTAHAEVHAGDFNGDGLAEVLVSDVYHFAIFAIEDGSFVEKGSALGEFADDTADALIFPAFPIDVDGDGSAEIVAGSGFNGFRLWTFNNDKEKWVSVGDRHSLFGCGDLADAHVIDLNGDATPELLALGSHNNCDANLEPGSQWNRISVFAKKNGAVELEPLGDFPVELPARFFDVADFNNGDNAPDLIAGDNSDMMMFLGNGNGTFDPPVPIPGLAHFGGVGPLAGDFNGDGIDEIVAEQFAGAFHVLAGLPNPQVVQLPPSVSLVQLLADLNGDGRVDIVSLDALDFQLVLSLSVP